MPRREFTKETQRQAIHRAGFVCEGVLDNGLRCRTEIGRGKPVEYDHVLSDWMGGEPTLQNCAALCKLCHKVKTALDAVARAEAKHRFDKHNGIKDPHRRRLVSRGLPKAPPQHSATRRVEKLQIAYSPERSS